MKIDLISLAGQTAPGLIIGMLVAWFSVSLSLRQFYSEKWWERKYEAYASIFEALFHMKNYAEQYLAADERRLGLTAEVSESLASLHRTARQDVYRAYVAWSFILSPAAVECLSALNRAIDEAAKADTGYDNADEELAALQASIVTLQGCAQRDLKMVNSFCLPWPPGNRVRG